MTSRTLADVRRTLLSRASTRHDEVAHAAHALYGAPPEAAQLGDLLDFFCVEWVDAEGWTEAERAAAEGAVPAEVAAWSRDVHTGLFVVDGWSGAHVQLRDAVTEQALSVWAPGVEAELPRRTVLRARILPWGSERVFYGEPDVWEPMGVIARMELVQAWQEGPEPDLLDQMRALRAAFAQQREERDVWVGHFGSDTVVFDDAADMDRRLGEFLNVLFNQARMPSLGGRTRSEAARESKGDEPRVVRFTLGPTLSGPGRPGAIYDAVEGVHFLPALGELFAHLDGAADHEGIVRLYLDDPGITRLPFRRAAARNPSITSRLAQVLGRLDAPVEFLLAGVKESGRRATPSVLPGLDD